LVTGTKYYGIHLGPTKTPMRETDPRHLPPNFYFDQIDWLAAYQRGKKWTFTDFGRRRCVAFAPGTAMSILPAIASMPRSPGTRPAPALSRQAGRLMARSTR